MVFILKFLCHNAFIVSKNDERRKDGPRIDLTLDVDLGAYGQYEFYKMLNLSSGGAFIKSRNLQSVGTIIKLKFKLPHTDDTIEATGEVMWVYDQRGSTDNNVSGMGIKFNDIDPKDKIRINAFVQSQIT